MKAVILAGGFGSRLSEETVSRPKPMVEIGGVPILTHIMRIYSAHGIDEFVIALGYRGEMIKRYFIDFPEIHNDLTVSLATGEVRVIGTDLPPWTIHLVDTGMATQTGGRLRRVADLLDDGEPFLFTYGDGVADIDVGALIRCHREHGRLATVTTVRNPARFGRIRFDGDRVSEFYEKPEAGEGWINGGFFCLEKNVLEYIDGDDTVWERDPVEGLARDGQLVGYRHYGFWSCMDTMKEKQMLERLWSTGKAPWMIR